MQKHIAKMVGNSQEFYEVCERRHPDRRNEIHDWAGAAFLTHFFICLREEVGESEKWQEVYWKFAVCTSTNLHSLMQDCIESVPSSPDEIDVIDKSQRGCAKWLYDRMITEYLMLPTIGGYVEFRNSFADECLVIRAEIVTFKKKFL